jgi:phosphinothricin acetyltransferase
MDEVRIRSAAAGDIAAITAIYADAVRHGTATFELEPPDEAEMAGRLRHLQDGGFPYLVATTKSGRITGYAYAGPYRARPAYGWTVEDSIYLDPHFHRRNIGSFLLARLIDEARRGGFRQMVAVIGDSAQEASIALHRRAGFSMIGTMRSVGFKHGRWLDTVLMQRALGVGDADRPGNI